MTKRRAGQPKARILLSIFAICSVFTVVVFLVWPHPVDGAVKAILAIFVPEEMSPEDQYHLGRAAEFIANVVLFIPVGLVLTIVMTRRWVAPITAVAISVVCESVQLLIPQRVPSLLDIVANSAGGLIGYLIALAFIRSGLFGRASSHTPQQR